MRTHAQSALARFAVVALIAFLFVGSAVPAQAALSNAAIRAKRRQVDDATRKSDQLSTDLELRGEELAQIEDAVAKTRKQIAVTEADLKQASLDQDHAETLLGRRASSIYRNGPVDVISVFVGATDFQDFITRLDLMRRIGRSDASVVATVKDAKARVVTAQKSLESRQAEQISLRTQSRRKQAELVQTYETQQKFIAGLNGELKRLMAAERVRLERIAAEAAARAAQAARDAAQAHANDPQHILPFDPAKLGSPHTGAVAVAKHFLGVRYVWGGTSPSGFDCSGLMLYSYAQVGVQLPRTSRSQFRAGAYIPPNRVDLLEPGDMVFFGIGGDPSRIHHVGMYVGGGNFIHAPATGDVVRIVSLGGRIASRGDYVGACRP